MAVNAARLTLIDIAKRQDPSGVLADIAEVLHQSNPIVQDMPLYPSNAPFGHRVTMRSSLPDVSWSKFNKGSAKSKSSTKQVVDTIGMLVALSEVDAKLKDVVTDFDAHRRSEDEAFLEKFSQTVANTIFYGNELTEESGFTGLQPRMNSLQTSVYTTSYVKGYGAGQDTPSDLSSIYIVDWGKRGVHGIYPPAYAAGGLAKEDQGKQRVLDSDNNAFMAFATEYKWYVGLTVEDPRHMARLANIDISETLADTAASAGSLIVMLQEVIAAMAPRAGMQRVAYAHRSIIQAIRGQVFAKSNLALSVQEYLGEWTPHVDGVPIVACDQVSGSETVIT